MTVPAAKLRILAIGRDANAPESALALRYAPRLRPSLDITALADGRGSPVEIKRREADALLKRIIPADFVIALDQAGVTPDSPGLATLLARWRDTSRPLVFIIGGAEGLDRVVIDRADATLSLGRLTFPHLLARAILAEQLYRAQTILDGHPYHRTGRPAG